MLFLLACGQPTVEDLLEIPYVDTGIDENEWALIPAGEFLKGHHEHETMIAYDYEIMVTDVTNRQYAAYLNEAMAMGKFKIEKMKVKGYYPGEPFDGYKH